MPKTAKEIQDDVCRMVKQSGLPRLCGGGVYKEGRRPIDSTANDIVVIFTAGYSAQIETGFVTLHVYYPDRQVLYKGSAKAQIVEDEETGTRIEAALRDWVMSLTASDSDYRFHLARAICSDYDPDIRQHFAIAELGYEYYGGES